MVFRIILVLTVIFVLVPHHPDLGLPLAREAVSPLVTAIRTTVARRAAAAAEDLRQYDHVGRPEQR